MRKTRGLGSSLMPRPSRLGCLRGISQTQMTRGFNGGTTVTAHEFRTMALALPATLENEHMGHPDFRVRGKIFATLGPHEAWGMVKVTLEQQREFVRDEPKVFQPFNGAWGARGCTKVHLLPAKKQTVRRALVAAWRNTAPKRLCEQFQEE